MKLTQTKVLRSLIGALFVLTFIAAIFNSCSINSNDTVYQVNSSKCTACQNCISVCRANAISIVNGKAYINSSKCVGCGNCYKTCQYGAISSSN